MSFFGCTVDACLIKEVMTNLSQSLNPKSGSWASYFLENQPYASPRKVKAAKMISFSQNSAGKIPLILFP